MCLIACAAPAPAAQGDERIQAPVYTTSGSWTYHAVHDTYAGIWRSDLLTGDFEISMRDGSYKIARPDGKSTDPAEFCPTGVMLPTPDANRASAQYFNFPLWIGKSWRGSEFMRHRWRSTENTVTGMEAVVTPAGTFPAYRIERWSVMFVGITTYHLTQVYFYSPQTRSTVKYECREEWRDLQGNFTLQEKAEVKLTNYKVE